jgi:hypothetical protein
VGAAARAAAAQTALKAKLPASNMLRMRGWPQRVILELVKFEPAPTHSNTSITLVTPLSEEPV